MGFHRSASLQTEDNSGSLLIVDGYGRCQSYGNERFHVSSVWRIHEGADCDFSSMQIRHQELGDIISINGPEDYMNSIMDSTEFAQKLAANKVTKSESRQTARRTSATRP